LQRHGKESVTKLFIFSAACALHEHAISAVVAYMKWLSTGRKELRYKKMKEFFSTPPPSPHFLIIIIYSAMFFLIIFLCAVISEVNEPYCINLFVMLCVCLHTMYCTKIKEFHVVLTHMYASHANAQIEKFLAVVSGGSDDENKHTHSRWVAAGFHSQKKVIEILKRKRQRVKFRNKNSIKFVFLLLKMHAQPKKERKIDNASHGNVCRCERGK
jgi:hypothetical protein